MFELDETFAGNHHPPSVEGANSFRSAELIVAEIHNLNLGVESDCLCSAFHCGEVLWGEERHPGYYSMMYARERLPKLSDLRAVACHTVNLSSPQITGSSRSTMIPFDHLLSMIPVIVPVTLRPVTITLAFLPMRLVLISCVVISLRFV